MLILGVGTGEMFIYCGYPDIGAANVVLSMSNMNISPKPSGGYISINEALNNYPEGYCLLEIELPDDAELDEMYLGSTNETWKIYKSSDVISIKIYNEN